VHIFTETSSLAPMVYARDSYCARSPVQYEATVVVVNYI